MTVPGDPSGDIYQLVLPSTSCWQKEDNGKWGFRPYVQMLANNNVGASKVITKMQFDTKSPTPKLLFSPVGVLTPEQLADVEKQAKSQTADNYIKKIAARIIAVNPELKELDTRIVYSRDFSPNAFSIGDGTISFNAGLFVYLENEAQMAFIVCHELAHYYLDHSRKRLNRYIQIANSDSLKKEMKKLSKQEYRVGEQFRRLLKQFVFNARKHSRDNEEEADKIGLHFFKNSGYNGNAFITAMQLLDKADDTALFAPLTISKVLSFPGYPFKERWIRKESPIFGSTNPVEGGG